MLFTFRPQGHCGLHNWNKECIYLVYVFKFFLSFFFQVVFQMPCFSRKDKEGHGFWCLQVIFWFDDCYKVVKLVKMCTCFNRKKIPETPLDLDLLQLLHCLRNVIFFQNIWSCFLSLFPGSVSLKYKPVNWLALQINWLVSIIG